MQKQTQHTYLTVNGQEIPIKVYREQRRNVRASVGKKAFILRMPRLLTKLQGQHYMQWFERWVCEQLNSNENVRNRFQRKAYQDGDTLRVGAREYILHIEYLDRKTSAAKQYASTLHLKVSQHLNETECQSSIRTLLSRVVAQDFQPYIEARVQRINQMHFKRKINKISLKYNHSNWGSCSTKGNVNLSTRLLFAPTAVIDYVIVHELSHLFEMNHSPRFWAIVARAMPDYKKHEQWLKENGHLCDF